MRGERVSRVRGRDDVHGGRAAAAWVSFRARFYRRVIDVFDVFDAARVVSPRRDRGFLRRLEDARENGREDRRRDRLDRLRGSGRDRTHGRALGENRERRARGRVEAGTSGTSGSFGTAGTAGTAGTFGTFGTFGIARISKTRGRRSGTGNRDVVRRRRRRRRRLRRSRESGFRDAVVDVDDFVLGAGDGDGVVSLRSRRVSAFRDRVFADGAEAREGSLA